MNTKFSLLSLLVLCFLGASAQSPTCTEWTDTIPTGSLTELDINFPDTFNVAQPTYYLLTGDINVDVKVCSDIPNDPTLSSIFSQLSSGSNSITLALASNATGTTTATSAAPRGVSAAPLTSLLAVFLSAFFIFPKSRAGLAILACILCVALYVPSSTAASGTTITLNIGVPSQITKICVNGQCTPWPATSTAASSAAATTGSNSGSTPASSTTGSTTGSPSTPPPAITPTQFLNLRILIIAALPLADYNTNSNNNPDITGADFAALAFNAYGTPYDYVVLDSTTDLSTYLSTSGTGLYSGIITVNNNLLSPAQTTVVTNYQLHFGVRWAIVGSNGAGLSGITMGDQVDESFTLSMSPSFSAFGACLNPTAAVPNTDAINWSGYAGENALLYPGTITDSTVAVPVIMAQRTTGPAVAAAEFTMTDGTKQLHYFVQQSAEYVHSMIFAPLLVNWISPGGLFIGARRLTLVVQPDDLFLGSNTWSLDRHTDANTTWYRMSAFDLQSLADFFDDLNAKLPTGSYLTVEWPTNFGGADGGYYTPPGQDDLLAKALEIQDKFYYLSHTWDHPCTFDTLPVAEAQATMNMEIWQNVNYLKTFFAAKGLSKWSNNSMITPCVTGLHNAGALAAMYNNSVFATVSDEGEDTANPSYEPPTPYHGVYSVAGAPNGFAGIYFVPRQALDIGYCDINPAMVVDEYNTLELDAGDTPLTFEEIMEIQLTYGVQNKMAFRHDPYMLHQANGATFFYDDPILGVAKNTSMIALWIERVVTKMSAYYSLPWYQPQMDDLVKIFQQRDAMDACGITTTLGTAAGQVVQVQVSSTGTCEMSLSGGAVLSGAGVKKMEYYGPEVTAWIELTANTPQTFSITPINI